MDITQSSMFTTGTQFQNVMVNTISTKTPATKPKDEGIMADETREIFETINYVVVAGIISLAGSVTNVINMIVFVKQGMKESINISLLGLAISDFGALVTLVWMSICFNPYFEKSDISFNSKKVQYLTAGWPHVCFARITSFITAYITFERCLSIALPLKVKRIITPRRACVVVATIFTMLICSVLPVYYAIRLDWVENEERNKTLIDIVFVENGEFIEDMSFSFNVFSQISSVVIVVICSLILVHSLRKNIKWRQSTSCSADNAATKEKKIVKMVLFLAIIFIVCFLPSAINLIVMISLPEYSIGGTYKNLFQTGWSFLNILEATNSSINIFVYYRMSSKYRGVFRRLLCVRRIYVNDSNISAPRYTEGEEVPGKRLGDTAAQQPSSVLPM